LSEDIDGFKKEFGESAIDFSYVKSYKLRNSFISLGSRSLNRIVTGDSEIGVVQGRIYEIYGTEGCGKTTLALESICSCQKKKGKSMFIDVEHCLDITYAKNIGINFEDLLFSQPDSGEMTFEMILWAIDHKIDLIVVDSVAAMTPLAEIESDMEQELMGVHPRLMGKGLRKVSLKLGVKTPSAIIFINQIRMKIGVMFGNPEVTTGGKALKFFSDVRIELRDPRKGKIVEEKAETGKVITAKTVKNKIFPPFKKTLIPLTYGHGIDKARDVIQVLIDKGVAAGSKKADGTTGKTVTIKGMKQMSINTFRKRLKSDKKFKVKMRALIK